MADNMTQIWAAQEVLRHPDAAPEDVEYAKKLLARMALPDKILGLPVNDQMAAGIVGVGKTYDDLLSTGKQLFNKATGGSNDELARQKADDADQYGKLRGAYPVATTVGEIAATLPIGYGASGALGNVALKGVQPFAGTLPRSIANNALTGAALGAADYSADAGDRASKAAIGAAGGAIGDVVGRGLGRLAQPFQGHNLPIAYAEAQAAKQAIPGITIPTMQQLGSKAGQFAEMQMQSLPGGAGLAGELAQANKAAINQAANRTMGLAGEDVFVGAKGMDPASLVGSARQVIGDRIDAALAGGEVMVGSKAVRQINKLTSEMNNPKTGLSGDQLDTFNKAAQLVVEKLSPTTEHKGIITSKSYQSLRQKLGDILGEAEGGNTQQAIKELRNIVDREAASSLGKQSSDAFKKANREWSAMEQVKRGVDSPNTPGNVRPLGLKAATDPDLAAIHRYGQNFRPFPDSYTGTRLLYQQLMLNPLTIGGGIGGGLSLATDRPELALAGVGAGGLAQLLARGSLRGTGADTLAKWSMSPTGNTIRKALPRAGGLLGGAHGPLYEQYD